MEQVRSGPSDTVSPRSSDAPAAAAWLQKQPFLTGRAFKTEVLFRNIVTRFWSLITVNIWRTAASTPSH